MIEVFRCRKRFHLVFEHLDHTLLDELEIVEHGLGWEVSRRHIYQVIRGLSFCHSSNVSEPEGNLQRMNFNSRKINLAFYSSRSSFLDVEVARSETESFKLIFIIKLRYTEKLLFFLSQFYVESRRLSSSKCANH